MTTTSPRTAVVDVATVGLLHQAPLSLPRNVRTVTEEAVWHPMPMTPAVGKPAIRALISEWLRTAPRGEVHRQVSDGKTVMHERTDRCSFGGREVVGPVAAAFEIDDGRISAWREYFDPSPFAVSWTSTTKSEASE